MENKIKPVHEVRLGCIKAAVWKNETQFGTRYNATFSRLYKEGEKWQSSSNFSREDLLLLAKVADQTHSWIFDQGLEDTTPPVSADPTACPRDFRSTEASTSRGG